MDRRITIVGLIICCIAVLPAFAGTWREDFEDGDFAGWEIWGGGNWKVESGELLVSDRDITALYTGEAGWSDYTVQADVLIVKVLVQCDQLPGVAILARYQRPESPARYHFAFEWQAEGAWMMGLVYVDASSAYHVAKAEPFPVEEGRWYNFKMTLEKDHIEAYLDNELIVEFDDSSEDSGKISLGGKCIEARFDNVVITGPEIPDGGPGFAVASQSKLTTMWGSIKRGR
jgi:hypothetical protein